jgi:hypothetical protein
MHQSVKPHQKAGSAKPRPNKSLVRAGTFIAHKPKSDTQVPAVNSRKQEEKKANEDESTDETAESDYLKKLVANAQIPRNLTITQHQM